MKPALTAEQEARDMLERIGVKGARSFSAGDLIELANLIAAVRGFTPEDVALLRFILEQESYHTDYEPPRLKDLADRIEALLPPEVQ